MSNHLEAEEPPEGAEGAAVLPLIPEEAGINPLLLAVLHAFIFIDGSTEEIIDPVAADEAVHYLATYMNRVRGPLAQRLQEDMEVLIAYARQQGWTKDQIDVLVHFLPDFGVGGQPDS